jgi:hypothetical protein
VNATQRWASSVTISPDSFRSINEPDRHPILREYSAERDTDVAALGAWMDRQLPRLSQSFGGLVPMK